MSQNKPINHINPVISELKGEKGFLYIERAKQLASKGYKVISFGVGQPDIPTPDHIIDKAKEALDNKVTGYTETNGIKGLREAITEYLNNRYNAQADPDDIIVTTGAKTALFLAIASYIKPGDKILIPEPSYPAYGEVARFLGAQPIYIKMDFDQYNGFRIDIDKLEEAIDSRTKMIVLNNPHNPTGKVFTWEEVKEIFQLAVDNNMLILADEIYDNFTYEKAFKSILSIPEWKDYVLYVNGFSKTFSMTGWRLGYLAVKKDIARSLTRLAVNIYSCAPSFVQVAGIEALKGDWDPIYKMIEEFRVRRDTLYNELSNIPGFKVWKPEGAFYMFPKIDEILNSIEMDVERFVEYLLDKHHVVTLPGTAFPDKAGDTFIRFSYATSVEDIKEGAKRIKKAVEELVK